MEMSRSIVWFAAVFCRYSQMLDLFICQYTLTTYRVFYHSTFQEALLLTSKGFVNKGDTPDCSGHAAVLTTLMETKSMQSCRWYIVEQMLAVAARHSVTQLSTSLCYLLETRSMLVTANRGRGIAEIYSLYSRFY